MFSSLSIRSSFAWMVAIIAASFFGGLVVFLTSDAVRAELVIKATVQQTQGMGDRQLVLQKGASCSSRAWPNYEPRCQFDKRRPFDEMPTVRIIVLR
jgi:hypothetical protein